MTMYMWISYVHIYVNQVKGRNLHFQVTKNKVIIKFPSFYFQVVEQFFFSALNLYYSYKKKTVVMNSLNKTPTKPRRPSYLISMLHHKNILVCHFDLGDGLWANAN